VKEARGARPRIVALGEQGVGAGPPDDALVNVPRRYPSFDTRPETRKNARMSRYQHAERIIEVARQWARAQKNILAVALVGSYARKTARPASDIDLVMLTYEPTSFRTERLMHDGPVALNVD
jgi:hypothetical protein